jgi:hypothetical protein
MASSVSAATTDDLDGSADAETVTFGVGGVTYEIDLDRRSDGAGAASQQPHVSIDGLCPKRACSAADGPLQHTIHLPDPEGVLGICWQMLRGDQP